MHRSYTLKDIDYFDDNGPLIRIAAALVSLLATVLITKFTDVLTDEQVMMSYASLSLYILFSFIFMFVQKFSFIPNAFKILPTVIIDISALSFGIYAMGEYGILFMPFYFVIILGMALRYGKTTLYVGIFLTQFYLILLLLFNPVWQQHAQVIYALMTSLIFVLLLINRELNRLNDINNQIKEQLKATKFLSNHDSLTTLANRHLFNEYLHSLIQKQQVFDLFFIDLDRFKQVNDTLGHHVGDEVLIEIAQRLLSFENDKIFVARISGDEFILINQNQGKSKNIAESLLVKLAQPYFNYQIDFLTASIGIASFPQDAQEDYHIKSYADQAMYHSKQNGKNRYLFYKDLKS